MSADPAFLLRLAEANLARGELAAAAASLEAALARADGAATRAAAEALAVRLCAAAGDDRALAQRVDALLEHARGRGPAPRVPAPAPDPLATTSQTSLVLRRIVSSPDLLARLRALLPAEPSAEPSLPVLDVVARLLDADLDTAGAAVVALDLVARASGAARAELALLDEARTTHALPGQAAPIAGGRALADEAVRARAPVLREEGGLARLGVPVVHGDETVGAVLLEGPRARLGERERALVEALAGLAAPGLARALRAERSRRALEKAERALARERAAARRLAEPLMLGRSPALRALRALLERVAPTRHTVLIEGESGTGKELVARTLHALGDRPEAPFVAENVGALGETLLEAELFGHVKGAFTGADADRPGLFQQADGGTLLLDEVGEMPPALQVKLLRALEAREVRPVGAAAPVRVDVRVLAATHRDLAAEVAAGRFREDLFHRLAVVRVRVPPLRERPEDLSQLLEHFLSRAAGELGRAPPTVPPALLARLQAHPWPGNVRELQAWATRHVLLGATALDAPEAGSGDPRLSLELRVGDPPYPIRDARAAFDRAYIALVLQRAGGNVSTAARLLDMNRSHLSTLVTRLRLKA